MFKRATVAIIVLLFLVVFTVVTRTPSEAAAPRRIEVSVTPASGSNRSNIRLQWEGSYTVQKLSSINANGDTTWSTLASGVVTYNENVDDQIGRAHV